MFVRYFNPLKYCVMLESGKTYLLKLLLFTYMKTLKIFSSTVLIAELLLFNYNLVFPDQPFSICLFPLLSLDFWFRKHGTVKAISEWVDVWMECDEMREQPKEIWKKESCKRKSKNPSNHYRQHLISNVILMINFMHQLSWMKGHPNRWSIFLGTFKNIFLKDFAFWSYSE
jgi:hypothetical protein